MVADGTPTKLVLGWSDDALEMRVEVSEDGVARLSHLVPRPDPSGGPAVHEEVSGSAQPAAGGVPILDVVVAGSGRSWSGRRYSESVVGNRMRYVGHSEHEDATWHELAVALEDQVTGLTATVTYQVLLAGGVVRGRRLTNNGASPLTLESVTSFLGGGLAGPGGALEDVELLWAENDWLAEARWQSRRLRDALPDVNRTAHRVRTRGRFALTSEGSWSSGTYLPMGAAINRTSAHTLLWQIEHSGGWHWQVGERPGTGAGSSYVALRPYGPSAPVAHHARARGDFRNRPRRHRSELRGF